MAISKSSFRFRGERMKLSQENLTKVFNYVSEQIEDDKGRGEFDKDTLLLSAVSRTIEMIEDNQ